MDYYDEWRTILTEEERLAIIYANWESWFDADDEHLTIAVCLNCGNALQGLSFNHHFLLQFHCEVCE